MTEHEITTLLNDIRIEANCRSRGRKARLVRLASAGLIRPLTAEELASNDHHCAWPKIDMTEANQWARRETDRRHEAAGGLYHACTVRVSNGTDADLPTLKAWGCRVTRLPVSATFLPAGFEFDAEKTLEEPLVAVRYASVGPGFMEHGYFSLDSLDLDADATEAEACRVAEQQVRASLFARGDVFSTRADAETAAIAQLHHRVEKA